MRIATLLGRTRAVVAAVAAALLTSCGGGTSQYEPFEPLRLFAFGDEMSALTTDGHHWGVNGLKDTAGTSTDPSDDVFDCAVLPNWVASLAAIYNFKFAECNSTPTVAPQAFNRAAPGARVADVAAQVEAEVAAGGFRDRDIVTVMVGINDVLDLYAAYDANPAGTPEAGLIDSARARGRQAAAVINRLISLGAKVVVANVPDMGLSPYARAEAAAHTDIDRAALISRLSAAFNEQLGVSILLDGRFVALVQIDQRSQAMGRLPEAFGLTNVSTAVCATAPPACTTQTLVTGGVAATYLWSSDRWFAAGGQSQLAGMAIDRALRNPF